MNKFLTTFAVLVASLFCVFYFSNKSLEQNFKKNTLSPLKCDLNHEICEVIFEGKSVKFDFLDEKIFAMNELTLNISGLNKFGFKSPSLRAYGLNMNMGNIDIKLIKNGIFYTAKMVLSACVIDIMRYRFEILDNGKKTGLYIDFDLRI